MSDGAGLGLVERAGDAAARGEWKQAFDLLMEADADGLLTPAELPVLGEVAYAAGHLDVTIEAWERAYAACLQAGDQVAAGGAPFVSRCTCSSTPRSWRPCMAGWHERAAARRSGRDAGHAWPRSSAPTSGC